MYGMIGGDVKLELVTVLHRSRMENGQIFHNKYLLNKRKFLGLIRENAS